MRASPPSAISVLATEITSVTAMVLARPAAFTMVTQEAINPSETRSVAPGSNAVRDRAGWRACMWRRLAATSTALADPA